MDLVDAQNRDDGATGDTLLRTLRMRLSTAMCRELED